MNFVQSELNNYMTKAWDKEKIWDADGNRTHDLPNTERVLYLLSYENLELRDFCSFFLFVIRARTLKYISITKTLRPNLRVTHKSCRLFRLANNPSGKNEMAFEEKSLYKKI